MSNQLKIDCLSCGYADQLGSGMRNLFKYSKAYGGSDPQLTDGDVFRAEVSLKALEVALKDSEVALKGAEVALIGPEVARKMFLPHLVCAGHAGRNGTYCLVRPRQRGRPRKNARTI